MAREVADLLDTCRETIAGNVATLERCSAEVRRKLDEAMAEPEPPEKAAKMGRKAQAGAAKAKAYPDKLVSHLAWITDKIAEVTTALRQLEKHDRTMARTPEQRYAAIEEYIRQIDPVRRADLGRLIAELEEQRQVLS